VEAGTFPAAAETVLMDPSVLDEVLGRGLADRLDRGGRDARDADLPAGGIPLDRDL
jgi:hypothetical protein